MESNEPEKCNPGFKVSNFNLFGLLDQEVAVFENCQIKGTVGDGNDGQIPATYSMTMIFGFHTEELVAIGINPTQTLEQAYEEGWIEVISNHLTVSFFLQRYQSFFHQLHHVREKYILSSYRFFL